MADTHSATTASMNSSSTKSRPIIEIDKERRISTSSKKFMKHMNDYVQPRGISPEVVENVIRNGEKISESGGKFRHTLNKIEVFTNQSGDVITVIPKG